MTEEEAKTKTCHKTLIPLATIDGSFYNTSACLGSGCMAWLPVPTKTRHGRARDLTAPKGEQSWIGLSDVRRHEQHNIEHPGEWEIERFPPEGYCGLAGRVSL